ncbi:type II secretion system protein GspM [Sedimenticola selenatireducens]|uniref:type II secretion system protein GspM n=1 Tax=Sedimenticola selenatireducens TaxID=191960 RepID=UPI0004ADE602|nr:type II secretion system protein GspM [Sedimenticola selenatireducens]
MSGLSPGRHCLLSWSLLLLVLLLLFLLVVLPWQRQNATYDETLRDWQVRLQQFREKTEDRAALEAQLNDPGHDASVRTDYLRGSTPALTGAELQQKIKTMVEATGGQLLSTQLVLPSGEEARVPKVSVKVRMIGDTADLLKTLYAIESSRPILFVEDVAVRSARKRPSELSEMLNINLTVVGYMHQGEAAQ